MSEPAFGIKRLHWGLSLFGPSVWTPEIDGAKSTDAHHP